MFKIHSIQRASSWLFRKITRIRTPWFKNFFIKQFAKLYKIEWQDYARQSPAQFTTFNDFFTRELKEGARPIENADIVSPADGKIAAFGQLDNTTFIHAKGHQFTLESLIADPALAKEFANGQFATVYLSPRDYHRIHMPITGTLQKTIHIPGKLYSVSLKMTETIPALFAENERHVSLFNTEKGKILLILVGAVNVSSIETIWAGTITPPYGKILQYSDYSNESITIEKGQEMGRFNMGSTVIMITDNSELDFAEAICEHGAIKLGEALLSESTQADLEDSSEK